MEAISSTGFRAQMTAQEKAAVTQEVDTFNKVLNNGKVKSQSLGKDDFLKILITQLTTQDPTDPVKDKDSIAQMAQFSALEQMTNMSSNFSKVSDLLKGSQAVGTLGKEVDVETPAGLITGIVTEVTAGQYPQVKVGERYYDYSTVQSIRTTEVQ